MSPAKPEPNMPIEVMIGPPTSRIRRPKRSATMPAGTFTIRRARANTVSVSPTIVALTPKSFAYSGNTGDTTPWPAMTRNVDPQRTISSSLSRRRRRTAVTEPC